MGAERTTLQASQSRRRILWVSHLVPFPPKGGVQQRSFNLLRELSRYHDVAFVGFNQRAHLATREALEEGIRAIGEFADVLGVLPVPTDRVVFGRLLQAVRSLAGSEALSIAWLRSDDFARQLTAAVQSFDPELVHFDTISLAPYRYLACMTGRRTVLNHHNVESDMMRRRISYERGRFRRAIWQREARLLQTFETRVCTDFDLNLMCSALDGERLVAISPGARVVEVPNGVDIDYFRPSVPAPQRRAASLVFAGRLNWYPNASALDWFAEAIWPRVKEQLPDASMTVIGKNATKEVRDWAAREPRVELTGFVPDVRPYLEEAEVYVCPIFDGGGTKLKVLDAMAMGCAIVAHPIACEGINVSDGVELLMASTPEDFARQVRVISADPELASRLGAAARRRAVAEYSFTSIGARLDRLVSAVADGSPVLPS